MGDQVCGAATGRAGGGAALYLPEWLARHNMRIFGSLIVVGLVFTALRWWR